MKKTTRSLFTTVLFLATISAQAQTVTVTVTNQERQQRQQLVEVNAQEVFSKLGIAPADKKVVVTNALGQEVPYQLTFDGLLLIDAAVRPCGEAVYNIAKGTPQEMKTFVCGRQYPERVDDIAWENDRTAYRIYGPALQRSGERAFGVDVWVKNTPDLEVEKRYTLELAHHHEIQELTKQGKTKEAKQMEYATTYHFDHGYGLDCYKVGPSLGGGAPALVVDGKLLLPYCYKEYKILDNGPLRFTVELTYNPTVVKGETVVEHRIISLDKGSNFNKMVLWYEGVSAPRDVAAGVVVHQEDTQTIATARDYVAYADPTDNPQAQNFQIYVAALFPQGVDETKTLWDETPQNGIAGHVVGMWKNYTSNQRLTYYFGSAWSKNDVTTFDEWKMRIENYLNALHAPLSVTIN